jgi:hypothetical protein
MRGSRGRGNAASDAAPVPVPVKGKTTIRRPIVSTRREDRERSSREGGCKARGEEPEGVKTGGDRASAGLNHLPSGFESLSGSKPWRRVAGGWRRGFGCGRCLRRTTRGHGTSMRRVGWMAGRNPWSVNPGRGSGMKQACKARGGENRRGREKRRGRNEMVGLGSLAHQWTLRAGVAMRGEPYDRCQAPPGVGQVRGGCAL